MTTIRRQTLLLAGLSVLIAVASFRFAFLELGLAFPGMPGHIADRESVFLAHVVAASIALAAGGLQFFPRLRTRRPGLHRWTGRLYGVAVLVGGAAGAALAFDAEGGPIAGWGFGLLAALWLICTGRAVQLAMTGRIAEHRVWMIRSFALAFAAVTLRMQLPFFFLADVDYPEASRWISWSCWVPNLLVAEWMIARERHGTAAA